MYRKKADMHGGASAYHRVYHRRIFFRSRSKKQLRFQKTEFLRDIHLMLAETFGEPTDGSSPSDYSPPNARSTAARRPTKKTALFLCFLSAFLVLAAISLLWLLNHK